MTLYIKINAYLNYISECMTLFIPFLLSQRYHITRSAIFALDGTATDGYDRINFSLFKALNKKKV